VVVTPHEFMQSLSQAAPPRTLNAPLAGLWWAKKGDWDKAHRVVQDASGEDAAWVHAYLHRVEGDLGNAGYWYRQAHRKAASGELDAEWTEMVAALLQATAKRTT
jgi:hypothetical protein